MDITFHYFAIKTLALAAGFSSFDAQVIASYSQFVDEYNLYYDFSDEDGKIQHPVTTGFDSTKNYIGIGFSEKLQASIVTPFHFIPPRQVKMNKDERTQAATVGDNSTISHLLAQAKSGFMQENSYATLMHIGMVLHTFADTHAHQKFSGFTSSVNKLYNGKGYNNNNNDEVDIPLYCRLSPAVGHARADHLPDLTYVRFTLTFEKNLLSTDALSTSDDTEIITDDMESINNLKDENVYRRNNTDAFIEASKQILNYLRSCRNEPDVGDGVWKELSKKLKQAFLCKLPKNPEKDLPKIWGNIFDMYDYSYSKKEMWVGFFPGKIPKHAMYDPEKTLEENDEMGKLRTNKYKCTENYHTYNRLALSVRTTVMLNWV